MEVLLFTSALYQCFAAVGVLCDRLMPTVRFHQGLSCEQSAAVALPVVSTH